MPAIKHPEMRRPEKQHGSYKIHGFGVPGPKLSPERRLAGLGVTISEMELHPMLVKLARTLTLQELETVVKLIRNKDTKKLHQ